MDHLWKFKQQRTLHSRRTRWHARKCIHLTLPNKCAHKLLVTSIVQSIHEICILVAFKNCFQNICINMPEHEKKKMPNEFNFSNTIQYFKAQYYF